MKLDSFSRPLMLTVILTLGCGAAMAALNPVYTGEMVYADPLDPIAPPPGTPTPKPTTQFSDQLAL